MKDLEKIINECVEIEMDEGGHIDFVEDHESELDFYLSNVIADDYIGYLKESFGVTEEEASDIQYEVEKEIRNRMDD